MTNDAPPAIAAPDPAERRRDGLDQQIRCGEQRVLQQEQQALGVEQELTALDRKLEESRDTPAQEPALQARDAKAQERLVVLETVVTTKQELDMARARRAADA